MTWQPIATAPKDGTDIIGGRYWSGRWEYAVVSWHAPFQVSRVNGVFDRIDGWSTGKREGMEQMPNLYHPTHWVPVPKPIIPDPPAYVKDDDVAYNTSLRWRV